MTSEEITTKRREQRKRFKMDRANAIAAAAAEAEEAFRSGKAVTSSIIIPSGATWKPADDTPEKGPPTVPRSYHQQEEEPGGELNDIVDLEHLQLTPQEAFFLIWCFDCLSILNPQTVCFNTYYDISRVVSLISGGGDVSPGDLARVPIMLHGPARVKPRATSSAATR